MQPNVVFLSGELQPLRLSATDRRFFVLLRWRRCQALLPSAPGTKPRTLRLRCATKGGMKMPFFRARRSAQQRPRELEARFSRFLAEKRLRIGGA